MNKCVLLYGSDDYQKNSFFINLYKSLGVNTIFVSDRFLREMNLSDEYLVNDSNLTFPVLNFLKNKNVILVLALSDFFVPIVGLLNEKLNLTGLKRCPAIILNDKLQLKKFLEENNLPSWPTILPKNIDEIQNFPYDDIFIKSTRSSGGMKLYGFEYQHITKKDLLKNQKLTDQIFKMNSFDETNYLDQHNHGQILIQKSIKEPEDLWILDIGYIKNKKLERYLFGNNERNPFPNNIGCGNGFFTTEPSKYYPKNLIDDIFGITDKIIELSGADNCYIQIEYNIHKDIPYALDIALRPAGKEPLFKKIQKRVAQHNLGIIPTIEYQESLDEIKCIKYARLDELGYGTIEDIKIEKSENIHIPYIDLLKKDAIIPKYKSSVTFRPFAVIGGSSKEQVDNQYKEWISTVKIKYK